ncbi:MAG: DNA (cytosine-5-)-methyltransferase [Saprospiraceae bacterium]|jgi:DNA (cytosine-5)-methyltransferase 1
MKFTQLREKTGLTVQDVAALTGYNSRTVYRWENGETQPRKAVVDRLLQMVSEPEPVYGKPKRTFNFIDLFAGIGGLRMGFESVGGKCVFTSEWNKYSRQTYQANFECDHEIAGDITQIHEVDIPVHDVLLAGFPCQPFSIAGVSKKNSLGKAHGFECKTQGTLFFDVARIIAHHRPAAFLLENVKNLHSHDKGQTFKVIRETLEEELGYNISWKIIDAKRFVPQHRERIFIAGFREDSGFSFDNISLPDLNKGPRLVNILHPQDGTEEAEEPYTYGDSGIVSDRYTLTDNLWSYLVKYAEKHREKGNGFGFGLNSPEDVARTLSARYHKDGSEILIKQEGRNPRRLTPRECARLMGYDRTGRPAFEIPVSDTQAYRQFGNGVVVPVIEAVAKHMKPHILGETNVIAGQMRLPLFAVSEM